MAGETTSANMNLPIPGVSVTEGPTWATDLNNCLTIIDGHTHASGSGVPITPDAININGDLTFASNNAIALRASRFTPQVSPITASGSDLNEIYVSGVDLYYNDGSGNQVRITQSGGVAGSPGSISNLTSPASAAYVAASGKFVWQQDTNKSADMDFGSAIMRNDTTSSFALTLQPPTLSANYTITLPFQPASQKFMTLDASGTMSAPWAVDNSTLEVASNTTLQIKDLGVTTAKIANAAVTQIKQGSMASGASGSVTTTGVNSSSYADVTGATCSVTSTGRPVWIGLIPNGDTTVGAYIGGTANAGAGAVTSVDFRITEDGTAIAAFHFENVADSNGDFKIPPGCVWFLSSPSAASHTYQLQARTPTGASWSVSKIVLKAIQL